MAGTPPGGVVPQQPPLDVAAQHVPGHQWCCVEDLIIHTGLTNFIRKKDHYALSELVCQLHHYQTVKCRRNEENQDFQHSKAANAKSNIINTLTCEKQSILI